MRVDVQASIEAWAGQRMIAKDVATTPTDGGERIPVPFVTLHEVPSASFTIQLMTPE